MSTETIYTKEVYLIQTKNGYFPCLFTTLEGVKREIQHQVKNRIPWFNVYQIPVSYVFDELMFSNQFYNINLKNTCFSNISEFKANNVKECFDYGGYFVLSKSVEEITNSLHKFNEYESYFNYEDYVFDGDDFENFLNDFMKKFETIINSK